MAIDRGGGKTDLNSRTRGWWANLYREKKGERKVSKNLGCDFGWVGGGAVGGGGLWVVRLLRAGGGRWWMGVE